MIWSCFDSFCAALTPLLHWSSLAFSAVWTLLQQSLVAAFTHFFFFHDNLVFWIQAVLLDVCSPLKPFCVRDLDGESSVQDHSNRTNVRLLLNFGELHKIGQSPTSFGPQKSLEIPRNLLKFEYQERVIIITKTIARDASRALPRGTRPAPCNFGPKTHPRTPLAP